MTKLRALWRSLFDVRAGEATRTLFMSLYLVFVMIAYYILKPVSAAMFLNKFNIDKLPYLYILIAIAGGILAQSYTRLALNASLTVAVLWAMAVAAVCLVALWWLVGPTRPWTLYVFNIWVSLFSIVLISQGWLVASNLFDARQAKRLYGLLGLGCIAGGWIGSAITSVAVHSVGSRNLILVSAIFVVLAYFAFHIAAGYGGANISRARAARERASFSWRDTVVSIARYRQLRVMIGVVLLTFIVDELVDFQFQAVAKQVYQGEHLTAFLARYFVWLNSASMVLQFFFTAWVVRRAGVGGILQIGPTTLGVVSLGTVLAPGIVTTVAARFLEALNRYTFSRTAMELLFLPLPTELRNRTKAFIDIFVDRAGRGIAGLALAALLAWGVRDVRVIAVVTICCAVAWLLLARRAHREYLGTLRDRLQRRRLDLESARISVGDPATIALLEQIATTGTERQACYAVSLLAEAPGYDLSPLLDQLSRSPLGELRSRVFEIASALRSAECIREALQEISSSGPAMKQAVAYILVASPEKLECARQFLSSPDLALNEAVLDALGSDPHAAGEVITDAWLETNLASSDPQRRALAAQSLGILPDHNSAGGLRSRLAVLIEDEHPSVCVAACRAASLRKDRSCCEAVIRRLDDPRVRAVAIESLAGYGNRIIGLLGDFLIDEAVPATIRRQIPRVLRHVSDQRTVDVLLRALDQQHDAGIREAVLKALNRLRDTAPELQFGESFVTDQILGEAKRYYELYAALEPFREHRQPHTATGLLVRTIEDRLRLTIERLFRLLGLRYPQQEIHAAYTAVQARKKEQFQAALEFLDNVLDRPLKRVLVPLLDAPDRVAEQGRSLFGVEVQDVEATVRELILTGDPWLAACAMATAAERKLHALAPDIVTAGRNCAGDVREVARTAASSLS